MDTPNRYNGFLQGGGHGKIGDHKPKTAQQSPKVSAEEPRVTELHPSTLRKQVRAPEHIDHPIARLIEELGLSRPEFVMQHSSVTQAPIPPPTVPKVVLETTSASRPIPPPTGPKVVNEATSASRPIGPGVGATGEKKPLAAHSTTATAIIGN